MLVTFTNTTDGPIYLSVLNMSIAAGASLTTRRSRAQLDSEQPLKVLVADGDITLSFELEAGDEAALVPAASPLAYDNDTRPDADTVPEHTSIWNTDDNAHNWSDGTNWRDANGDIT